MKLSSKIILLGLITVFLFISCSGGSNSSNSCTPGVYIDGYANKTSITLQEGKINSLQAKINSCGSKTDRSFYYSWYLDGSDKSVSSTDQYKYISCGSDVGTHTLKLMAFSSDGTTQYRKTYTVKVEKVANPTRPSCYDSSMDAVRLGYVKEFTAASECLDNYLKEYVCDVDANFSSGLAKEVNFLLSLQSRYENHTSLTVSDVEKIGEDEITPMVNNFLVVKEKAPKDWSYIEEGLNDLIISDGHVPLFDPVSVSFNGEFDLGEVDAFLAESYSLQGWLYTGEAFQGLIEHILKIPIDPTIPYEITRFLDKMISNEKFLTFTDNGKELLLLARGSFIDSINLFSEMFDEIKSETDDQSDDIIRYWDCGSDAVCPGDPAEYDTSKYTSCKEAGNDYRDRNVNGKCDEAYSEPDKDGTEGNLKYDEGEPLGTEKLGFPDYKKINIASDIPMMQRALSEVSESLSDPNHAINYDKIMDQPDGTVKSFVTNLGIPYPEIRLGEFFITPTELRYMVPLYDKTKKEFLLGEEYEPFEDTGYDGCTDQYEDGNGGCVTNKADSPYNSITNKDPNHDDIDPVCAPDCNLNDGYDNDGDGKIDGADNTRFGKGYGDLGVESNFIFDFVDENDNKIQDADEKIHEPFKDTGVDGISGSAGNGKWDSNDLEHVWPKGSNVGPVNNIEKTDPKDGTPYDISTSNPKGNLIDFFYLFFPSTTFSGVLTFPDEIKNNDNVPLNDHAKLHRFISKIQTLARDAGYMENGIHEK